MCSAAKNKLKSAIYRVILELISHVGSATIKLLKKKMEFCFSQNTFFLIITKE